MHMFTGYLTQIPKYDRDIDVAEVYCLEVTMVLTSNNSQPYELSGRIAYGLFLKVGLGQLLFS